MSANVLVLSGYGINCEEETAFGFNKAGAKSEIVHVNDLISKKKKLSDYEILVFPGGFSYGDDLGSGNALANKIKNNLWNELKEFAEQDKLILGICNGFQAITNLGLLPNFPNEIGAKKVALTHNNCARYQCRWIELKSFSKKCVFSKGIERIELPIAHGEGKLATDSSTLKKLNEENQIVFRYVKPDGEQANGKFPYNPNGSIEDIAGICDSTGKIFGLMPHPERNILFTQKVNWTKEKEKLKRQGKAIPEESAGMQIFRNAVNYFR